jgi:hypothetical protein
LLVKVLGSDSCPSPMSTRATVKSERLGDALRSHQNVQEIFLPHCVHEVEASRVQPIWVRCNYSQGWTIRTGVGEASLPLSNCAMANLSIKKAPATHEWVTRAKTR